MCCPNGLKEECTINHSCRRMFEGVGRVYTITRDVWHYILVVVIFGVVTKQVGEIITIESAFSWTITPEGLTFCK